MSFRVPINEYEKNLNSIIDYALSQGIKPILITAPFDATQFYPFSNFPFPVEFLSKIHMKYNSIVRKVASDRQVPIIDLELAFSQVNTQKLHSFFSDGIHFTPTGCRLIAELIVQRMRDLSIIKNQ